MESFNVLYPPADPFDLFSEWYSKIEKTGRENYNAVALSTSSPTGSVSSRIVLLKDFNHDGFVFFTNYNSRKGRQITSNPHGAMLFYWPDYKRQVRIEGSVHSVSPEESDRYFNSRSRGHKFNALVSNQSSPLESRELLLQQRDEIAAVYKGTEPVRPEWWGGYRLIPDMFEFWQEGEERFHDRIEYRPGAGGWKTGRLYP
jgi:pyridoxamine-phosphate oxidase